MSIAKQSPAGTELATLSNNNTIGLMLATTLTRDERKSR
jgi:hypothetical protein